MQMWFLSRTWGCWFYADLELAELGHNKKIEKPSQHAIIVRLECENAKMLQDWEDNR